MAKKKKEVPDRPLKDPLTERVLSNACWDGEHCDVKAVRMRCTGWLESVLCAAGAYAERCECICHEPEQPRKKKGKCISLPLPDCGTIDIYPERYDPK